MKKNTLKKAAILGIASLALLTPTVTRADKVCTIHKNFYMYLLIDTAPSHVFSIYQSDPKTIYNGAYFPMLPKNAEPPEGQRDILKGRICMMKDGKTDGDASQNQCPFDVMTVEEYFLKEYEISQDPDNKSKENFIDENGKERSISVYTRKSTTADGTPQEIKYYYGAEWFKCTDDTCKNTTPGGSGVDTSSISPEVLAKGSYLPTQTNITFNPATSNRTIITRKISTGKTNEEDSNFLDYLVYEDGKVKVDESGNPVINPNAQKVVPFSIVWKTGEAPKQSLVAPAVYYVEYQTCAYSATINYYYFKDGEPTEDKVKLDDGKVKEPYHRDNVENGDGDTVESPVIKHCAIVDKYGKRNDADKSVTYKINNGDFTHDVYYRCDAYDATINYYYYKDDKPTKEPVDFGKDVDNPYTETGFLPGETKTIDSPEKKGCTIVDTKGNKNDADKKVTISIDKINPKDFEKNVYYYCPSEDTGKELPTGDALIYLAWAVGLGAIGYSVYYFKKMKKEEV